MVDLSCPTNERIVSERMNLQRQTITWVGFPARFGVPSRRRDPIAIGAPLDCGALHLIRRAIWAT
jgi:hypothetical protein